MRAKPRPERKKILVINLDEWLPRQVVSAYQRRGPVEQINKQNLENLRRNYYAPRRRGAVHDVKDA